MIRDRERKRAGHCGQMAYLPVFLRPLSWACQVTIARGVRSARFAYLKMAANSEKKRQSCF